MFEKIESQNAPKAIGPYSPAVKLGDFVYISGQIPLDPETGEVVTGGVKEQTHQVMRNIFALLDEVGLGFRHIVKTTIYIKNMDDFGAINEVYGQYLEAPYPARATIEVSRLPKDVLVEIECFVIDTTAYEGMQCGCEGHNCCEDHCCCGE